LQKNNNLLRTHKNVTTTTIFYARMKMKIRFAHLIVVTIINFATSLSLSTMKVISLYRYAVKGLSGDPILTSSSSPTDLPIPEHSSSQITSPLFLKPGETFPDDRRFAFIKSKEGKESPYDPQNPQWLHKENFLCAFSAPVLMATFDTEYRVVMVESIEHKGKKNKNDVRRELTIWKRNRLLPRSEHLLGPLNLSSEKDREAVSCFFSSACGERVELVGKETSLNTHQFGNTRSGVKAINDTRTIHIVNAATIREVSEKIGVELTPRRFRPNIVVDGWEPWMEFEAVGKSIQCYDPSGNGNSDNDGLILDIISKTVRCEGISIDPHDENEDQLPLDMPKLLQKHFPEHGPYLGVYAIIRKGGNLCEGSHFRVIENESK